MKTWSGLRVLLVTPNFPPLLNPIAINTGKLAMALVEAGVEVTVVTRAVNPLRDTVDGSRCWNRGLGSVVRLRPPWYAHPEKTANIITKLRFRERTTSWFASAAYDYCRGLLKKRSFDLLFTRSLPVDGMLVGSLLRKEFKIKWAAGLNDPFPPCLYPPPYAAGKPTGFRDALQIRRTRKALEVADHVVFPCPRLARLMEEGMREELNGKKVVAFHIGWQPPAAGENGDGEYEILHIGSLGSPRATGWFLALWGEELQKCGELGDRIKMTFVGKVDEGFREFAVSRGLERFVSVSGPVSYEESLGRISKASALLLIEAPMKEGIFFPSKFSDYARSGKPLLLFSPENGTVSDFVGGYSHPGFLGQREEKCREKIKSFLKRIGKESLGEYRFPRPEIFEPRRVTEKLLEEITK